MAQTQTKEVVRQLPDRLPDDCTIEDVQTTCTSSHRSNRVEPRSPRVKGFPTSRSGQSCAANGCIAATTIWSPAALEQLEEEVDTLAERSPQAAARLLDNAFAAAESLDT